MTTTNSQAEFSREESIAIGAPPEAVFHYIADLRRHGEWGAQTWDITPVPGPERGPGATFASTAQMRFLGRSTIRIVAEEPPVRFVFDCVDWSGCHRWSMLVQPEGTCTRLRYRMERLQGPWWMHVLQPILLWPLGGRRYMRTALANIKMLLETEHQASRGVKKLAL